MSTDPTLWEAPSSRARRLLLASAVSAVDRRLSGRARANAAAAVEEGRLRRHLQELEVSEMLLLVAGPAAADRTTSRTATWAGASTRRPSSGLTV